MAMATPTGTVNPQPDLNNKSVNINAPAIKYPYRSFGVGGDLFSASFAVVALLQRRAAERG
jgi:hypothetical protein